MVDSAHLFPKNGVKSNSLPTSGHYKANYENFPHERGRLRDRSQLPGVRRHPAPSTVSEPLHLNILNLSLSSKRLGIET